MKRLAKMAIVGALASTACVGAVTPAEAHVGPGVAIGAGLLGLGLGAAIASDHRPHYYSGYYAPPPPPPPPVYYAPPPPPPPPVYYAPPPSYAYDTYERCRVVNHWDGYYGRYVQTRRCW